MLYAKVIYTGVADHSSASDRQTIICADRFDFEVLDNPKRAIMTIHRGKNIELLELSGDVWVMNESGKTVSQFAVPFSLLQKDECGEAAATVVLGSPEPSARKHS